MPRDLIGSPDEEFYAGVADELNDIEEPDHPPMTLDDLLPECVERAERFARLNGLPWPPGIGDYDRYCERMRA